MATHLREAALAAIAARLATQIATATVERSRRAPVDVDKETLPRLVVESAGWSADDTVEFGTTHYTLELAVVGYVRAATAPEAEAALSVLHAAVIAALVAWTPDAAGLGDPAEDSSEFRLMEAEEAARPVGEFVARFTMLCTGATGVPTTP